MMYFGRRPKSIICISGLVSNPGSMGCCRGLREGGGVIRMQFGPALKSIPSILGLISDPGSMGCLQGPGRSGGCPKDGFWAAAQKHS